MRDDPSAKASLGPADQKLAEGVLAREPRALAKAITLVESTRTDHQARAQRLLEALLPRCGGAVRLGVAGSPGAGKSTLVEALGLHLVERGLRLAVLAVDPSSAVSGGSILGDKTRMERLSRHPGAFIRPSPSGKSLGGVAEKTREAMLVCEAAGFDVVLVETVGSGQLESTVAGMVDVFALLELPNAGDELQAMKRGVLEVADLVVVTKADLDAAAAERSRQQLELVLSLQPGPSALRRPVRAVSAVTGEGVAGLWEAITQYRGELVRTGALEEKRRRQAVAWMWTLIDDGLRRLFREHPAVARELEEISRAVAEGATAPASAAARLLGHLAPGR